MTITRKENKTADGEIPYVSFPNKSLFIHGSTSTRTWRTNLIEALDSGTDILLLDPWKNSWDSYVDSLQNEIENLEELVDIGISSGDGGEGTGIVDGYVAPTIPDIENTPYFWEKRNSEACSFHFFAFDSDIEIANHIVIQMKAAVDLHPNNVVVYIPKNTWRVNYSIFLKTLPRENYFGTFENAVARIKELMDI